MACILKDVSGDDRNDDSSFEFQSVKLYLRNELICELTSHAVKTRFTFRTMGS
jgi:hypothetical protein